MLKDITLGQFFPADTPVHRLDPRTKLLCVILYIVALFSAKSVLTYGIMITVLAVSVLVSRVPFKSLTKGLKPVYFVVAFTAVMNMFFTAGTPVADVWLLRSITWEGVVAAVQMVLRIVMLIMGTFLMTYTTSPIALTDGMESLLGPLKKLRLPSRGPRKRKRRRSHAEAVRPRRKKRPRSRVSRPRLPRPMRPPKKRQRPRPRKCRLRPVTLPEAKKRKSSILTFPTCTRSRIILSVSVTMRK